MSTNSLKDLISFQTEITQFIYQDRRQSKDPDKDNELLGSIYQYLSMVEWFSFLVNINDIKDKRIINLFWPIIKSADTWYSIYFNELYDEETDKNMFSNLKALTLRLKDDESMHAIHIEPFEILNKLKGGYLFVYVVLVAKAGS
jgi:hypothetical protein